MLKTQRRLFSLEWVFWQLNRIITCVEKPITVVLLLLLLLFKENILIFRNFRLYLVYFQYHQNDPTFMSCSFHQHGNLWLINIFHAFNESIS